MTNPTFEFFKNNLGKPIAENSPSPVSKWLDGVLVALEEDSLSVEYIIRKDMCNPAHILHGGVAATMMDDIIGMTIFSMGHTAFYATVNLSIDYLFSAKIGEKVIAKSKIIRVGKKIAHAEGEIRNEQGKIIAKCTTNLVSTSNEIKSL
ncbi:PaaI family thioesterase [Arcicella sp. DC2W]|uniref:PaaI family thioesterase n=1 Tax=Arcicella gelida TaxID=2984195 RepID=A0ABU5S1T5_9BACT|nr:PaaI family thioesterase [Arcicella sp. DC2W]MEA5402434.1 PaaI family thioesterase [Arcicella sp. DC2W]